jgi:TolB-like protein
VEEANLSVHVSSLRRALGDVNPGESFIETVPKRGYRFNARVQEVSPGESVQAAPAMEAPALQASSDNVASYSAIKPALATVATSHPHLQSHPGKLRRLSLVLLAAALVLAALTYWQAPRPIPKPPTNVASPRRLAILPFRNLKKDADNDFLELALADAVITRLGYVSAVTVRPSYAVERYRNAPVDINKAATELDVDTLLTGTFLREGDDLRVTSQLIALPGEKILWRGSFDVKYARLLAVQDEVSQEIIKGLSLTLPPSEAERLQPDDPIHPLAYEYYLRAVDLYARGEFPLALKMLEQSAQIAPRYAPIWAQLGRVYTAMASFQFGGRAQYEKAQQAYERALSLQPTQIETKIYMANMLTDTGRVEQAVPLLRDALRTNPNHAEAHWELGYALRHAGMLQESVAECETARKLDPGVKATTSALNAYLYIGEFDKFLSNLPADRDLAFLAFYRGLGHYYKKEWQEAAGAFDHAYQLDPVLLQSQIGKAFSYALANQPDAGLQVLHRAERKIAERGVGDSEALYKIAQAYAVLGDKASALRILRRSIENGFFAHSYFINDRLLDSLRREPQFTELMEKARQRQDLFHNTFFNGAS